MGDKILLVTGASGFIGRHFVSLLSEDSFIALGRRNIGFNHFISFDFSKDKSLMLPDGIETIVHFAGCTKTINKDDYFKINVDATANLIEMAVKNKVKKFVLISSQAAAGPKAKNEDDKPTPVSIYGKSKLLAEKKVLQYKNELDVLIIRPPAVFGPFDTDFYKTFKMVKSGIIPLINNSLFSYVYVKDLVENILKLINCNTKSGEIFFVSATNPISQKGFIQNIAEIMSKKVTFIKIPKQITFTVAWLNELKNKVLRKPDIFSVDKVREIVAGDWVCSNEKLKKFIEPVETPISDALRETYEWYKENKWL